MDPDPTQPCNQSAESSVIRYIFTAPRRGAPMVSLQQVELLADCGVKGDRHCEPVNRKSPDREVTLIELEHIEAFGKVIGISLAPDEPRRNLVTSGVDLNALCGSRFFVGEAELEGLELCEPCGTFAKRTHLQVLKFFVHKGGLRARIVRGGLIHVGDPIRPS